MTCNVGLRTLTMKISIKPLTVVDLIGSDFELIRDLADKNLVCI